MRRFAKSYNIAFDCLDRHASEPRASSKTALIVLDDNDILHRKSFAELSFETSAVARWLRSRGLRRGRRVVIQLPNGFEFIQAFLGAMKAGLIPVPVSHLLTPREVSLIMADSGAGLVLKNARDVARAAQRGSQDMKVAAMLSGDPAFWLYTSGTEGRPKGVIHAHHSIPAHDARSHVWMGLRREDVVFNTSAMNWSYSLTAGLLDVWRLGATAVVAQGDLKPERFLRILRDLEVTVFMSVPGIYRKMAEYGERASRGLRRSFHSVRVALSAGEKLSPEIRKNFRKLTGLEIREGLGMTEHSVYLVQPCRGRVVDGSCGRPVPGHRIAILRDDLSRAGPGEVGILASHRSCPGLMIGYYKRSKDQGLAFRGEWFLSGDSAYRDAKGNFFYVGRRDDVITAGGYRISPMEVEEVLNRHPRVHESAVVGREISPGKTVVEAYVVGKKESIAKAILRFAEERLARYKVPRTIVFVDSLPKTTNGKIKRKDLI